MVVGSWRLLVKYQNLLGGRVRGGKPPRDQHLPTRLGGTLWVPPSRVRKETPGGLQALQTSRRAGDRVSPVK
jgi:hypothetical protein